MIDFIKRRYSSEPRRSRPAAVILDLVFLALVAVALVRYGVLIADAFF